MDTAGILDLVHDSIFVRDRDGRILSWNAASEALYGWRRDEAVGQCAHALLATAHPEGIAALEAALAAEGRWEGEVARRVRGGEAVFVDLRWTAVRDDAGAVVRIVETGRDVTERRRQEEALRLSEYRYRNMFQAMAVGFLEVDFTRVGAMLLPLRDQGVTDLRGWLADHPDFVRTAMERSIVVDVNAKAIELLGAAAAADLVGQGTAGFWAPGSAPAYVESLVATMEKRSGFAAETVLNRLDGTPFDVLFTVSFSPESRRRGVQLIGIVDIGDRVRAEAALRKVQADFAHAARVSMLGELTASIAHEVNQPLAAIAASGEASLRWLARAEPDVAEVRALAGRIVADARRAADIIGRVRAMAQHRAPEVEPIALEEAVRETMRFLAHEMTAQDVAVEIACAPDLPAVRADRTQLQQVLVNLAVNAAQAMAGRAERRLAIRGSAAGGQVRIEVEDSGPGIPREVAARLFDSFFSTKESGMGMGLPICRSIVEAHGGSIVAEAAESGGARFVVTLPGATD